jgi:hypothetical protein
VWYDTTLANWLTANFAELAGVRDRSPSLLAQAGDPQNMQKGSTHHAAGTLNPK